MEFIQFISALILLSFGAAIVTVLLIALNENLEEFFNHIKNKTINKKRKKYVKENKKIELFETKASNLNLLEFEKWRVNDAILLLERENEYLNQSWVLLMNKKIKEAKIVLKDYEKLNWMEQNSLEKSIVLMLSEIASQIDKQISKTRKEKEEKMKDIYKRKIESIKNIE